MSPQHFQSLTKAQSVLASNRELITRFEQKIRATLARVWEEKETAP